MKTKGRTVDLLAKLAKGSAVAMLLAVSSCAKYPTGGSGTTTKRLVITMTVAGQLNSNDVYMIAFRPSTLANPTDSGPIPVVAPPWGNGFIAGNCTYFVRWDPSLQPAYTIYQFTDTLLNNFIQTGVPVSYIDVQSGGRVLNFQLDLSQLATSVDQANSYQSLQVNFLTMDRIPHGGTGSKNWDALGDGRTPNGINTWITIPLSASGTYDNNRYGGIEPQGDVISDGDPDLDITDFSVQVNQQ